MSTYITQLHADAVRGQKGTSGLLGMVIHMTVTHIMWVLGPELGPTRAANILNH